MLPETATRIKVPSIDLSEQPVRRDHAMTVAYYSVVSKNPKVSRLLSSKKFDGGSARQAMDVHHLSLLLARVNFKAPSSSPLLFIPSLLSLTHTVPFSH